MHSFNVWGVSVSNLVKHFPLFDNTTENYYVAFKFLCSVQCDTILTVHWRPARRMLICHTRYLKLFPFVL